MTTIVPDWQVPILDALVDSCIAEGILRFDRTRVEDLLQHLDEVDRKRPKKDQIGYSRVTAYHPNHLSRVINRAKKMLEDRVAADPKLAAAAAAPKTYQPPETPHQPVQQATTLAQEHVQTAFRMRLDKPDYSMPVLSPPLLEYLFSHLAPTTGEILAVTNLGDCHYDILFSHNGAVQDLYDLLRALSWVSEIALIPVTLVAR